jgi:nitronate monooxygenase
MFDLSDLAVPIIGAPMAGGPTAPQPWRQQCQTPAGWNLAAGYLTAEKFADGIAVVRAATTPGAGGVNLFVPHHIAGHSTPLDRYREELTPLPARAAQRRASQTHPDDAWDAKIDVVADTAPGMASFTFGCPSAETYRPAAHARRAHSSHGHLARRGRDRRGCRRRRAWWCKAEAGRHRGRSIPGDDREEPLDALLSAVAHGRSPGDRRRGLTAPVTSGGHWAWARPPRRPAPPCCWPTRRAPVAFTDRHCGPSVHPHGRHLPFSGRYARGLANGFTDRYDPVAPLGYPEVNQLTRAMRRAAIAAGDPHGTNLWAGTAWRRMHGRRRRHRRRVGPGGRMTFSRRRLLVGGLALTAVAAMRAQAVLHATPIERSRRTAATAGRSHRPAREAR